MVVIDPIRQRRRQQQHLPAITPDEVLAHPEIVLNPPDGTRKPDSLGRNRQRNMETVARHQVAELPEPLRTE
jgi:hypothetical protein